MNPPWLDSLPPAVGLTASFLLMKFVLSFCAMSLGLSDPTPQFGTAEYVGSPGNDHCQYCHQSITATYYRANDAMACPACAEKMRSELARDTHSAYMRALIYGIGAAILGLILYATFAIVTGIIIGYVSLAVGWMVGKAMMKGSGGIGGKRYQLTAVVLTYAAVSMAAVPIWIHYANNHRLNERRRLAAEQHQFEREFDQKNTRQPGATNAPDRSSARPSLAEALIKLALLGIASPLVEIWEGGPSIGWAVGIVILIVGIRIAWQLTAGKTLEIYGPFENSPQPAR
jgi:hypothetical protein